MSIRAQLRSGVATSICLLGLIALPIPFTNTSAHALEVGDPADCIREFLAADKENQRKFSSCLSQAAITFTNADARCATLPPSQQLACHFSALAVYNDDVLHCVERRDRQHRANIKRLRECSGISDPESPTSQPGSGGSFPGLNEGESLDHGFSYDL